MNASFASIEQRDHAEWRGRPVAITNGRQDTCIIICSYEAHTYQITTGMRLKQAHQLYPELIQCPAHPSHYAATSTAIMDNIAGYNTGHRNILRRRRPSLILHAVSTCWIPTHK